VAAAGAAAQGGGAEEAMMIVDRAFNQAVADRDLNRFLSFVADNASFETAETRGREAVGKAWAPYFEQNGPTLTWAPIRAEVLVGGDVGFTIGTWERRVSRDGRTTITHGQYLTVWRKQADGAWRAIFDTGSQAIAR
jgi:ketosteroid isomerase-like protein